MQTENLEMKLEAISQGLKIRKTIDLSKPRSFYTPNLEKIEEYKKGIDCKLISLNAPVSTLIDAKDSKDVKIEGVKDILVKTEGNFELEGQAFTAVVLNTSNTGDFVKLFLWVTEWKGVNYYAFRTYQQNPTAGN